MSGKKILSIIVPSYNMEAYLRKCLGSLVIDDKELFQKLDVIVVNDGSKDRTSEIAHSFEAKYPGVFRVIDKENGHYGSCVNAAVPVAKGEYVRLLDADDHVFQEGFERFLADLDEEVKMGEDSADMVICEYRRVDAAGNILFQHDRKWQNGYSFRLNDLQEDCEPFSSAETTFKTRILRKLGYRQIEGMPYTDTQWLLEPSVLVSMAKYFSETVICYFIGREGQSMTPAIYAKNLQHRLKLFSTMVDHYPHLKSISLEESLNYYHHALICVLGGCYHDILLGYRGHRCSGNLSNLDYILKPHPELYNAMGTLTCSVRSHKFHYVNMWRQFHSKLSPGFIVFRAYSLLISTLTRIKRILVYYLKATRLVATDYTKNFRQEYRKPER